MNVAVIGASADRRKFGNKAVRAYREAGHDVFPVNPHETTIEGFSVFRSVREVPAPVNVVLVYLPPAMTLSVLEDIAAVEPQELYLNPGSEDAAVVNRARELGLDPILACSIVAAGKNPWNYSA